MLTGVWGQGNMFIRQTGMIFFFILDNSYCQNFCGKKKNQQPEHLQKQVISLLLKPACWDLSNYTFLFKCDKIANNKPILILNNLLHHQGYSQNGPFADEWVALLLLHLDNSEPMFRNKDVQKL